MYKLLRGKSSTNFNQKKSLIILGEMHLITLKLSATQTTCINKSTSVNMLNDVGSKWVDILNLGNKFLSASVFGQLSCISD